MNSAQATHTITVNAGGNNIRKFEVPASRWMDMVNFTKETCKQDGIAAIITVASDRRGVIYTGAVA